MAMSLPEIAPLEIREDYAAAIDALEGRLQEDPADVETVVRLGFNLWYAVVEDGRFAKAVPGAAYAKRFVDLFAQYRDRLAGNADFCWTFGLAMSMFWYYFPGATEQQGDELLQKAGDIDPFYARLNRGVATQEEIVNRFAGRGILAGYYAVE